MDPQNKNRLMRQYDRLIEILSGYSSLAVAYSGGVDSTLLLAVAKEVLEDRVVALTAESEIHSTGETEAAIQLARRLRVRHVMLHTDALDDPQFVSNPIDRCYHCKMSLFVVMRGQAEALGIQTLAHGANVDDQVDFRPGHKAAEEMGVVAPLVDAGLTKADIRGLAKHLGLPNWDRPAMACLATRIPYGVKIQRGVLRQIDNAESYLRQMGLEQCRVRHHGDLARIEIDPREIVRCSKPRMRRRIVDGVRLFGYAHVCLDLEGYVSGKLNRGIGS